MLLPIVAVAQDCDQVLFVYDFGKPARIYGP